MRLPPDLAAKCLALAGGGSPPKRTRAPAPPRVVRPASRWSVTLTVPLKVERGLNHREHWAARSRRVAAEKAAVAAAFSCANLPTAPAFDRVRVVLTRLGGRRWDDDNNAAGLKAVRDAVARWLGLDDGDPRVAWEYGQMRCGAHGVSVTIEGGES